PHCWRSLRPLRLASPVHSLQARSQFAPPWAGGAFAKGARSIPESRGPQGSKKKDALDGKKFCRSCQPARLQTKSLEKAVASAHSRLSGCLGTEAAHSH